jgi:hypothetical protein
MKQSALGGIFFNAVKTIIAAALKLCLIGIAWTFKLVGVVFEKIGTAIEHAIIKRA